MKGFISVMVVSIAHRQIKITVEDSGIGIAKGKQSRLFTLFGKLEGNEVLNPQGSGLGLSIANAIASELGGKPIELQSEIGKGAEFTFYLNAGEERMADTPSDLSSTDSPMLDTSEDSHSYVNVPRLLKSECCFARQQPPSDILVVDDAEFNRLVMKKILTSLQASCDEAVNGLQALIQIRKSYHERGHCYSLILMDLEMPEMDGLTATKEIFRMVDAGELTKRPHIVACSAYSSIEDKQLCFSAGVSAYLEKPISKESLRMTLSQFL